MRSGRTWWFWGVCAALGLSAGCVADGPKLEQALLADRDPAAHDAGSEARYIVHCPDELEVEAADRPDCQGVREIGPDGRIPMPEGRRLHVDGLTPAEIVPAAAEQLGLPSEQVQVRVVGYNSQQIYLFGEAAGGERSVPYQGPETVVDLLQRVGGVAPSAAVGNVQVVRSHVADGSSPELFHVDLEAILARHDQRSNVRLQPFDEVYVGELRRSSLKRCVPPWLRPAYERMCGLRRGAAEAAIIQTSAARRSSASFRSGN
jgi:protein involved in polysaccharide export with SLBB domain